MGKKIWIPIVAGMAAVLFIIAGVIVAFKAPRLTKKLAVEKTLASSLDACKDGDLDAFLRTIDPEVSGTVYDLLDTADEANIVVRIAYNALIDFINDNIIADSDKADKVNIDALDRDSLFVMLTGLIDIDLNDLQAHNFKTTSFEVDEIGDVHITIYCEVKKDGTLRDDYMTFTLRNYPERKRWCIMKCDDEQGWLKGLKLLLDIL